MNPQGSGSSACVSQPVPEDLKAKVKALIATADWRGLFMIELLRDRSGTCWFVELNGSSWGSMALSRRQGLEYPAWHVRLAMDQSRVGMNAITHRWHGLQEHWSRAHAHIICVTGCEVKGAGQLTVILEDFRGSHACSKRRYFLQLAQG